MKRRSFLGLIGVVVCSQPSSGDVHYPKPTPPAPPPPPEGAVVVVRGVDLSSQVRPAIWYDGQIVGRAVMNANKGELVMIQMSGVYGG